MASTKEDRTRIARQVALKDDLADRILGNDEKSMRADALKLKELLSGLGKPADELDGDEEESTANLLWRRMMTEIETPGQDG